MGLPYLLGLWASLTSPAPRLQQDPGLGVERGFKALFHCIRQQLSSDEED